MELKPAVEFREDILKLHIAYLEKVDSLTEREREAFCDYLNALSRPKFVCTNDIKEGGFKI
jgi:hypothetical protein